MSATVFEQLAINAESRALKAQSNRPEAFKAADKDGLAQAKSNRASYNLANILNNKPTDLEKGVSDRLARSCGFPSRGILCRLIHWLLDSVI